ncbi:cortactin-binding protein 2-like isoform X4 [Phymastichus coffea]|uniref:cortactin-binding protein 2-like isoform X4 n=1 Tax=Phymastichus coffea TaxID=108790 RepID=UPI00273CE365|nr:cortactin-binding protein 2-like isoform X4 [Phymastichus coffea]
MRITSDRAIFLAQSSLGSVARDRSTRIALNSSNASCQSNFERRPPRRTTDAAGGPPSSSNRQPRVPGMVLASGSTSSQPESWFTRKIKIRQIADSGRGSASQRAPGTMATRAPPRQQQRHQQQRQQEAVKVRKITAESGGGASAGGARQQRPRNSADGGGGGGGGGAVLQSSSASAAGRNATGRAASPVLSQSGRRQAAPPRSRSPSPSTRGPAGQPAPAPTSLLAGLLRRQRRAAEPAPAPLGPQPRKCVSFGADAAERPRAATGRPRRPAHEARLYRKGVLQDRQSRGSREAAADDGNLPLSWEECLGGPRALLGAAHDADDELVQRIVNLANKAGLGNIQLNAQDNSGRTAISYLAGNGSALVLEACLALPGCDANLADNEGNAPLHFAAQAGQTECLNILLQRCPDIEVDARNNLGFTPLMKAGLQGRTKCAKILLFAGANPTLRDHGRGLRAEQWARFCCRYVCADVIERFARHRLLEKTTSCRWGSEPELAAQVLQGKLVPVPPTPVQAPPPAGGLRSKIRRVFRTTSNTDKTSFSLVSQLTSAALCASSPVLPKPGDVSPAVKSLLRPLSVPQLRITLVAPQDVVAEKTPDKCSHGTTFTEKIESTMVKPPRTKKNSK